MHHPTILSLLSLAVFCLLATVTGQPNRRPGHQPRPRPKTQLTDFRYASARIDGITRLSNDSLIVLSNGHYWILKKDELPRSYNVKGPTRNLVPGFGHIDSLWTDPYNEISPQMYLISNSPKKGLRVVCQEFGEDFSSDSGFCHLPVDISWKNALKDLNFDKPIDAVTWRNRTKDKEGGFWVFFQGSKMVTVDPYEMHLRYTYDLKKWMSINETITAAFYDYHRSVYHFFFEGNGYRTWTVNVSFMNSLPMSWDRAFLHGKLSPLMRINRDFFGFSERELRSWSQPSYERLVPIDEVVEATTRSTTTTSSTHRPTTTSTTTRRWTTPPTRRLTTEYSDVLYVSPRMEIVHNRLPNGKLVAQTEDEDQDGEVEESESGNSLEREDRESDSLNYEKQLMQLDQEGVLDFAAGVSADVNGAGSPFTPLLTLVASTVPLLLLTTIFA